MLQTGDYGAFRKRLQTLGAKQVLDRQWALRSTYTASELRNLFKSYLDDQDRIVVSEVGAEWASRRAISNLADL